jgi:hypothetical protein
MSAFAALIYIHIAGMPLGQLTKQHCHDIPDGLKHGIGRQSAPSPHLKTNVRPIRPPTYTYDEEGEITGIDTVADEWIMAVDSSSVDWVDEDDMREDVSLVMAEYLGVQVGIFHNPNIVVESYDHAGMLVFLANNAVAWGEVVG